MKLFKSKGKEMARLVKENQLLRGQVKELKGLCKEKDAYFTEMIADGLRHGSKLAGKHMADKREYLKGKY